MNNFIWHPDKTLIFAIEKPLWLLGLVFAVMIGVTIGLVIHSAGGSDDT